MAIYNTVYGGLNGGGGGDDPRVKEIVERTISVMDDSTITTIGEYAFYGCSSLTTADFPNVTDIGTYAFYSCRKLITASFPNTTSIGAYAFSNCSSLVTVNIPNATSIGLYAFRNCQRLITASFPSATSIGNNAFHFCYRLISLYLTGSSVPTLGTNVFSSTPIGGYSTTAGRFGSVYVPSSLWQSYQAATNWSSIASRIVSI